MKQVLTITLKRQQKGKGSKGAGQRLDGAAARSERKSLMGEEENGPGRRRKKSLHKIEFGRDCSKQEKQKEQRGQPQVVVVDGVSAIPPTGSLWLAHLSIPGAGAGERGAKWAPSDHDPLSAGVFKPSTSFTCPHS